ncbi:MAG: hypothetical protein AVDCRST_MAG76-2884 [uncultured Acidimicrobiales bacterium]|uniref:Peptidase S8/S53 domain-containing protein n=1 Tax=uncultured Acidimicrobiales bacterium TaxID=310071 RepID=A0A6J4IWV0_9ACTN|nr:MAG: hypothetical protein AVDCRST_MAG76-2884 [uncultured Acidimicrobiales bacterium]
MPTSPERIHVAVYFTEAGERVAAEVELGRVGPDEVKVLPGVVEGWTDVEGLKTLLGRELVVDLLDPVEPSPGERHAHEVIGSAPRSAPDPDSPELQQFRDRSRYTSLVGEQLEVFDAPVAKVDPRIHSVPGQSLEPRPEDAPGAAVYHIHLHAPMTESDRRTFEELGIDLAAYVPPNRYRTRLTRDQYAKVRNLGFVGAVVRHRLAETVTADVLREVRPAPEPDDDPGQQAVPSARERKTFDCVLHRMADRERVVRLIDSFGGATVIESSHLYIRFTALPDARFLAAVGKLPEVRRLDLFTPSTLLNDRARGIVGVDSVGPETPIGLTGAGEIVAIFDSGIFRDHPDLIDCVESVEAIPEATEDDQVGHGTHVAGTIAGSGAASNGRIRGMAPGARLVIFGVVSPDGRVLTPANWAPLLEKAVAKGAKVVNLSIGQSVSSDYDFGSLSVDEFVHAHPDVLVVVSAGNEGTAPMGYVGFRTICSPATAKNVLTVGASCTDRSDVQKTWRQYRPDRFGVDPCSEEFMAGDPDFPAAFSSRGPTDFNSIKPDLMAPGTYVLSTKVQEARIPFWDPPYAEDEHYAYLGGTSMAAPVVTGAAVIVREYLRTLCGNPTPSAALLKAILIAATRRTPPRKLPEDMVQAIGFPDFDQGFGRLDLATVLPGARNASPRRRLEFVDWGNDSLEALSSRPKDAPGQPVRHGRTYLVEVAENATEPLRVVLVWTDWPSAGVQNNLHLDLVGPGQTKVYGNPEHRYRRTALDNLLQRYPKQGFDGVAMIDKNNNVEQIVLAEPRPGVHSIFVKAENTPFPPQGYALCVVGELASGLEPVA